MKQNNHMSIDRSGVSELQRVLERKKSNFILEANLLQLQGEYPEAASRFADAASIEEQLASQLFSMNKLQKAIIHQVSALSCWVQAGNLHNALILGKELLQSGNLSNEQHTRIDSYLDTLRQRMSQWMRQWQPESMAAD